MMKDILSKVQEVTELIGHISTANGQQSVGIAQVSQAGSQLDQLTQENATMVEKSAAATATLQHQTEMLHDAVNVFR